ncbi:MAG: tripartite tricarboxylate transporter substrate-binding protein [Bordetella sp.]|nr:tripartite tricarboxylate transporter substrate-binding protein [Bordetella sp.]
MSKTGDPHAPAVQAIDPLHSPRRRHLLAQAGAWCLAGTGLAVPVAASAQDGYPSKPIRFVVPFAPGGSNDVMARVFAERLSTILKQPTFVENKPGANGVIGAEYVANGQADGYTLLFIGGGSMTPALIKDLRVDLRRQLRPIAAIARGGMTVLVSGGVPARTFPEFVEYARREKGKINYGYTASSSMLAAEMLHVRAGFDAVGVAYKGSGAAMTALVANEVQYVLDTPLQYLPLIKEGRLKALAQGAQERTAVLPEVPTLVELGYPDLLFAVSFGAWLPARTPDAFVQKLNVAFNEILAQPDVRQRILDGAMTPTGGAPAVHDQQIAGEQAWLADAARKLNYKPE